MAVGRGSRVKQPQPTAADVGRDAAPSSSDFSAGDHGSREGERAPEKAGTANELIKTMAF